MNASFDNFAALWQTISARAMANGGSLYGAPREIGGCSARDAVWTKDKAVLYRYLPLPGVRSARVRPVLICYALVNRPDVLDLRPGRSMVQGLLAHGLEVYLLDWGRPDPADRSLELADYMERYLDGAVQHLLEARRLRSLNLLGVCQGGTFSLCYCALHPGHVANLVTMVTPVDFQTPEDLLSKWARGLDTEAIRQSGNLPGMALTGMFLSLRPFRLLLQKYVGLLEQSRDTEALDTFLRMEQWIFDSPDQAANALAQFIRWFYQENRLVRDTLEINGRRVALGKIRQPVLNIYAGRDHIVPAAASTALGQHLRTSDYREVQVDTGHIGIYVSRDSQHSVAATIASWLLERS